MSRRWRGASAFVGVMVLSCVAAWLCGYDFDERNILVGYWFAMSLVLGAITADLAAGDAP